MRTLIGLGCGLFISYTIFGSAGFYFYLGVVVYTCFDDIVNWIDRKGRVPHSNLW